MLKFIEQHGKRTYGQSFKIYQEDIPVLYKLVIYGIKDQKIALKLNLDLNRGYWCQEKLVVVKRL